MKKCVGVILFVFLSSISVASSNVDTIKADLGAQAEHVVRGLLGAVKAKMGVHYDELNINSGLLEYIFTEVRSLNFGGRADEVWEHINKNCNERDFAVVHTWITVNLNHLVDTLNHAIETTSIEGVSDEDLAKSIVELVNQAYSLLVSHGVIAKYHEEISAGNYKAALETLLSAAKVDAKIGEIAQAGIYLGAIWYGAVSSNPTIKAQIDAIEQWLQSNEAPSKKCLGGEDDNGEL